ncbi:MAG: hypothetical protein GX972_04750 [Amphibacillus sp.]|nr:hypothetical protein [Amphibacillus sp.]
MALWLASTDRRTRKLDKYKNEILSWLKEHLDLSTAQIADWLDERYPDFKVGESTVRRYVVAHVNDSSVIFNVWRELWWKH